MAKNLVRGVEIMTHAEARGYRDSADRFRIYGPLEIAAEMRELDRLIATGEEQPFTWENRPPEHRRRG
jgi:hypothetical protein